MSQHEPSGYERRFYEWVDVSSLTAAEVVVPIVLRMVATSSVVDVGCGTGQWLREFRDRGVADIAGIDSERMPLDLLRIDTKHFRVADLTHPPSFDRQFDLAVSLEVAEHLPEEAADRFVEFLCSLSPVILFSAAIPGQGGDAHLNEQWPSYWAARFASRGFESVDVLRPMLWEDERVDSFYRQNILIYVLSSERGRVRIDRNAPSLPSPPMALVHPHTFTSYRQQAERKLATALSFRAHVGALPRAFRAAVLRRLRSSPSRRARDLS